MSHPAFAAITGTRAGAGPFFTVEDIEELCEQTYDALADANPGYDSAEERRNWALASFGEELCDRLRAMRGTR